MSESAYFLTVDWCKKERRGIFCDNGGKCFRREDEGHTELEMQEILGPFWLILSPKSELFSEEEIAEFVWWTPLAEYCNGFGIATMTEIE